jgi:hypothetical protein
MSINQNNEETINFKIVLNGTYWDKKPQYSVWLDDHVVVQSEVSKELHTVEFQSTISEGNHSLKIRLENKSIDDTVVENGEVLKDMLLNIDDISIDDISLGNLLWTAEYKLDEPQIYKGETINQLDGCVNLGWNGTYILKFTSPFYIWLLEKL